jgi:ankyrin repeat protein
VRKYLSSDAAEEETKSNIMYRNHNGQTCLHTAFWRDAPDDIIKTMIDIGGKVLVMMKGNDNYTVLHTACCRGASYNIIKMLIEVGGKDLVMAKNKYDYTALHLLCMFIKEHAKVAEKIKLILEVGDANLLLSTKNIHGKTPVKLATANGASNRIKKLLKVQSTTNSTRSNNSPSASIVPADNVSNSIPITQSNLEQDSTQSSSTNNDPNIPIRGLGNDQNHQRQLKEATEKAKTIQQDFDKKCIDYSNLEDNFQSHLKEAKEQILQIQQDYDQKCADCCHLKEENQVENTEKLQLGSALAMLKKELYQSKKAQGAGISRLAEQKEKGEKDNTCWKKKVDNYMQICSQQKAKLQEMKDKEGAPVAGMQMMKQKEVEAPHAKELEESNGKAADLEATVEAQRVAIVALSSEKDEIKKLTQICSLQKEELQLLKDCANAEGTKRKHRNEDGSVSISQSQSSKRSKVENAANTSSVLALDTNQAEDDDGDAAMIAGQLVQNNMLMSWYMAIKRRLRSANTRM